MSANLRFSVLTPDGPIVDSQTVKKVRVRLMDGKLLSVYPYHAPLIAETLDGEVVYVVGTQEKRLNLRSGVFFVSEARVMIYTGGKLENELPQGPEKGEEKRTDRFDRLAAALMSGLHAHPQHIPDKSPALDSDLDDKS